MPQRVYNIAGTNRETPLHRLRIFPEDKTLAAPLQDEQENFDHNAVSSKLLLIWLQVHGPTPIFTSSLSNSISRLASQLILGLVLNLWLILF